MLLSSIIIFLFFFFKEGVYHVEILGNYLKKVTLLKKLFQIKNESTSILYLYFTMEKKNISAITDSHPKFQDNQKVDSNIFPMERDTEV